MAKGNNSHTRGLRALQSTVLAYFRLCPPTPLSRSSQPTAPLFVFWHQAWVQLMLARRRRERRPLFLFWHQAWVQRMLARRRRERRHASFVAARMRWNKVGCLVCVCVCVL